MLVPSNFGAVYNMAFVILMILYVPTVVVGYFVYGDLTQSPILDSLPSSGNAGRAVTAAKLIITFHLLCAYPIVINVVSLEVRLKHIFNNFFFSFCCGLVCFGI